MVFVTVFGAIVEHELKPGGKDVPLTAENKYDYITRTFSEVTGGETPNMASTFSLKILIIMLV